MKNIIFYMALTFFVGCASSSEYTANGGAVLVQPTHRAWLKPGTTMDDENIARKECGEEIRGNKELRKKGALSDDWSDAYEACMNKKGFQYYKNRK